MNASGSDHPSDQTLRAYGVGQLRGDLADSVHSHLGICGECRQRVAELSADTFLDRLRDAQADPQSRGLAGPPLAGVAERRRLARCSGTPGWVDSASLRNCGEYEVLRELGRGGMGVVYLAWNKLMGRKEVLKVVSRELMDRRGVLERFLREIRSAASFITRISSPPTLPSEPARASSSRWSTSTARIWQVTSRHGARCPVEAA